MRNLSSEMSSACLSFLFVQRMVLHAGTLGGGGGGRLALKQRYWGTRKWPIKREGEN